MKLQRNKAVKGEDSHYQALASAVVLRAIADFRSSAKATYILNWRLAHRKNLTGEDRTDMQRQVEAHEMRMESIARFLLSPYFSILCDLDGSNLLDRLESEVCK